MRLHFLLLGMTSGLLGTTLTAAIAQSQITPDGTTNTTVNTTGLNSTITNGTVAGSNLFHSFQQFSIPTGGAATFDLVNTPAITTIFSRITGGSISNIDGALRTLNSTNPVSLFLLNPAGILFGPNASLNISGSFVGTTASSIKFANGTEFSASNPAAPPVLTISVPIGLQMGQNPGAITVQGSGYGMPNPSLDIRPFQQTSAAPGLQVAPGQMLALVGGDVNLVGGKLSAFSGQVLLGSVAGGLVNLSRTSEGWNLDYSNVSGFRDISFSQRAIVDTSGLGGGAITVQGRNITLQNDSTLLQQNFGATPSQAVRVTATGALRVLSDGALNYSGILTEVVGTGAGGNIEVQAGELFQQSTQVFARTYGIGNSGNVTTRVAGSTNLQGFATISSATYGAGNAGNVTFFGNQYTAGGGGLLYSTSAGSGNSGDVTVNASRIELSGVSPIQTNTSISASSLDKGSSGNVTINTAQLALYDNGLISSSTVGTGNAGNITVNASEFVDLRGNTLSVYPTGITSAALIATLAIQQVTGAPPIPSGRAGNITLKTPLLKVSEGATVSAQNQGTGAGGNITIQANSIQLNTMGAIVTLTTSGEGGNINLQGGQTLWLRHGSLISTTAGGAGNGGNITIAAPIVAGFENSDIIANAVQGRGGNIQINTEGIFGLKFRPQLTPDNDITASSELGVNGLVQVNTIGVDPSAGLVELPVNLTDSSRQLTAGCAGTQGNQFVVTGRGGIPEDPTQAVKRDRPWADLRDPAAFRSPPAPVSTLPPLQPLTEATTWQRNPDGEIELVATSPGKLSLAASATCATAAVR